MSKPTIPSYTVIRDTREQESHGWIFPKNHPQKSPPRCDGTVIETLDTGDYSMKGYEDLLRIERKADFSELWVNYSSRKTFEKEMERMRSFKYRFILIECPVCTDHFNLSVPQFKTGVPGKALMSWITGISLYYNIHVVPVGQCGMKYCQSIFQNVIKIEKDRWVKN